MGAPWGPSEDVATRGNDANDGSNGHLDGRSDEALPGGGGAQRPSLDVPAGSIYGFLGPNGAGKSTAIKLLAGLTRPTSGSASVAGIPITAGDHYRREVGYLAQEPKFYPWMTGRETLRFVSSLYPPQRRSGEAAITDILGRVGLADTADRKAGTYSGGMRQRLGIAQALVGRPSVLLLDEPVSSLDPIGRKEVLELMRDLKGETTVFTRPTSSTTSSASATTSRSSTKAS